jgi:hypothetical protein
VWLAVGLASGVLFLAGAGDGPTSYSMGTRASFLEQSGHGMKLPTHILLVLRL